MWLRVEIWFLWFVAYSIAGWIYETILCSIMQKKFVYRGFLFGPYCPIYGVGALMNIALLGKWENPLALFAAGTVVCCGLEYFTSWALEALFHARWWDYSNRRFNIKGRICLLGAVAFGSFSVVLIKIVQPFAEKCTDKILPDAINVAFWAALAVMVTDTVVTVRGFVSFEGKLKALTEDLARHRQKVVGSATAAFARFTKNMNLHERRMLAAFPRLKSIKYNDALTALRSWRKKH